MKARTEYRLCSALACKIKEVTKQCRLLENQENSAPLSVHVDHRAPATRQSMLGGENVLPFYTFDAPIENAPKVGSRVTRRWVWRHEAGVRQGLLCRMLQLLLRWLRRPQTCLEALISLCIRFGGREIRMARTVPTEELRQLSRKRLADAVRASIVVIAGCKNVEKDAELFCQGMLRRFSGKNAAYACPQEKRTTRHVGAAAGLAYKQIVGAESADRYQPCKAAERAARHSWALMQATVVMNVGSAAAGYGFEYVVSTMDRVKAAALAAGRRYSCRCRS